MFRRQMCRAEIVRSASSSNAPLHSRNSGTAPRETLPQKRPESQRMLLIGAAAQNVACGVDQKDAEDREAFRTVDRADARRGGRIHDRSPFWRLQRIW